MLPRSLHSQSHYENAQKIKNDIAKAVRLDAERIKAQQPRSEEEAVEIGRIYKSAYPRNIQVQSVKAGMRMIQRSIRCYSDLFVVGYHNKVGVVCQVINRLKDMKVLEVVKVQTAVEVNAFSQDELHPKTCIKFLVCRGEHGDVVHGFRQRRLMQIFESKDKEMSGHLTVQQIKMLDLETKFKADAQQKQSANIFLRTIKADAITLPDFYKYASRLIHPLLNEECFDDAVKQSLE